MDFKEYQDKAKEFAQYPQEINSPLAYLGLGLSGECGELNDKIKKLFRDKAGVMDGDDKYSLALEISDICWYLSELSRQLGYSLENIAEININKLTSRKERGKLGGSGDYR
jgi:NTP pyrophosphatase (non-canonical NTP hydrolase)